MTTASDKKKAAESEKDAASADESKVVPQGEVETSKQAEEKDAVTSAEKVEENDETNVFAEDAEVQDDDFAEGSTVEGSSGTVVERNLDGDKFDVPYVYLNAADLEPVRTSDSDDPAKSWTAQEYSEERKDEDGNDLDPVALVPVEATPGQVFRVSELPDRKVAEAAGVNYDQFIAGLPVRPDIPHEAPRKGIPA